MSVYNLSFSREHLYPSTTAINCQSFLFRMPTVESV